VARSVRASWHRPLAGVFRFTCRSKQILGEECGCARRIHFAEIFDHDGEPSRTHSYDTGAAWENFALQGWRQGLVVHGMEGFDYERARLDLRIPVEFQVEAMAAVGRPAPKEVLPEKLQKRESPNDRRKLTQSICEGPFRF
jgi:hypothetical protein